ncbi:3'-5' exonuclease [Pseudoalteromonas sp.]|uniref:3'-5' exonuclease n=1 Tax=Pseudoalteromonas sp. TaxID=53249 RepID=UPI003562D70A
MGLFESIKRFFVLPDKDADVLKANCFKTDYLVIDLELTGLNAKQDEIVSIAWVPISHQRIQIGNCQHFINNQVSNLNQSPVFHGIDIDSLAQGVPLNEALKALNELLDDKILIFHNQELDWSFLRLAFNKAGLLHKPLAILDTMQIEHKRLARQGQIIAQDSLTLANCRERYRLPEYRCHNALTDAMATAELFLAQANQISRANLLLVKHLM